jgi:branched-chain amino acid transport system substrate-binding protein
LQVLGQAIEATKSLDDAKLIDYMHKATFKTILGDVKFGADGEWVQSRVLQVQFQNIKGNDIGQFRDVSAQAIVAPEKYKSGGKFIYPYSDATK